MRMQVLVLLSCTILLSGCGGPSKSSVSLSGNWQMTLQSTANSQNPVETESGFLIQSGQTLDGSVLLSGQTISGQVSCAGVGAAVGQATGSGVTMTVTPTGQTVNLTGTPANNFTSMSGKYSILSAGCGQTDFGAWSANLVDTLTGNFQATLTSNGALGVSNYSGSVTQGPNTGNTSATLSGTMTSTNSPCFSSIKVAGAVSGTAVVLNLLNSDGVALGKLSGTMTTDASSINGTYRFSNAASGLPPTNNPACQGGDGGNMTMSVQTSSATS
jgi:hypothetical protein